MIIIKIKKNYRILVLSDGIIDDQENTKIEAEKLKNYLNKNEDENQFFISVGSIRYGTGNQQSADTRAIASVLRLNTDYNKSKFNRSFFIWFEWKYFSNYIWII